MWTAGSAWLAALVAGVIVGVVIHYLIAARRRSPWWTSALAGLVGAVLGRMLLSFSFLAWHPHFLGAVLGALVLSLIWALTRPLAQAAPPAS